MPAISGDGRVIHSTISRVAAHPLAHTRAPKRNFSGEQADRQRIWKHWTSGSDSNGVGPQDPKTDKFVMRVGKYVEIQLVEIPRDGQQGGKLKLAKLSNALLLQAHKIGVPIAGVAGVLGSMIEGRGLYLDSVGEFFQLYG